MSATIYVLIGLLIGVAVGGFVFFTLGRRQRAALDDAQQRAARAEADQIRADAETHARRVREEANSEAERLREVAQRMQLDAARRSQEAERQEAHANAQRDAAVQQTQREREALLADRAETKRERDELKREIERLNRRAEQLDARGEKLDALEEKLEREQERVLDELASIAERARQVDVRLMEVAGLTPEAARDLILGRLDAELEEEKAVRVRASIEKASAEAKRTARSIIAQAIQRSASETSAAMSVSVVPIPSDAMKGRLIGREGRNIRAFEALTGVDLIIDDTPEAVILSSFNPVRREVARHVLEGLVADGRIHPTRIEEMVHKAQDDMKAFMHNQGEEAAHEAGVLGVKPGLVQLLGRMYFRTSYGQNVLKHSVQVAHLTGIMAAELGLDDAMARRAGLMHDVGKSIDREIEGTHVEIGVSLAKRFGEPFEVIDAIAHHHDPENGETLYSVLVAAADAISAARPGARREELESYIKRLEQLESIAVSFPGVNQAYAIQAGREVRVIVQPEKVTDAQSTLLAREIAGRIEQDMEYPGQVQVTVVRESRAVEYAK
ncbi:ribonuclease Y [Deinococcus maricopensis]|uniref:Ribonuclease Y n=1 Tax=Deinococcus maricopensis (strain DSM 21211 / LMG 22137 / NRRL B-23946 / LB-34) TaxID=709986 RepID=E8UBN8_DEIML|nr:ribonuclease Y [Deinococcus maricopensis]ADV68477.1 2,3 cyclic-nucleotide 2-phosphodiesterase [Deinococcus maricopensis DSM 21211]